MTRCLPLVDSTGTRIGNLTTGPAARKPIRKRHRWKWCFECRKRMPHMLMMAYDPHPSYYDTFVYWRCNGCAGDHTEFPQSW